ncbi:polysaccharide export outer membrane protein [Sphingobium sp. AP50]|uniref:polysaccharide biosynthesis/export family protein n=1 Tax=Sphingobium sp. AP50 TaxID=1884369 RepID=UPI0008BE7CCB|nr:polysaccharide biosynthesis/export family protein [Sphingobium sp. AP50]SEJ37274.1 polysaccharide export outer membrane protein [Sphingobium sp. AP50]
MTRLTDLMKVRARSGRHALLALAILTSACTSVGPGKKQVLKVADSSTEIQGIQIIDLNAQGGQLPAMQPKPGFADLFGGVAPMGQIVGIGDVLQITIWEAPPAVLFGATQMPTSAETSRGTGLPDYLVGPSGAITIPFAGTIPVVGRTLTDIERDITGRLRLKAHLPQVNVRMSQNMTSTVSVVGDVNNSTRIPLTPKGETVLDAIAAGGGTKEAATRMTIQLSRGGKVEMMPLQAIIGDPRQNVVLKAGDVVTALYQPYSFTALGATGANREIQFEATGITLAQALGRVSGLQDGRADPKGMFLFRWEDPARVGNSAGVGHRADGRVPVIYRINMRDPATYFAMQNFQIQDHDVMYVSNSPVADFQRFVNILVGVVLPAVTIENALSN